MLFLHDDNNNYTYEFLLNEINKDNLYFPLYKTEKLILFFINFIKALASNKPLTLLDSDINVSEIEEIGENEVNHSLICSNKKYQTFEELLNAIRHSKSEITIFTSGTTGQPKKVIHTVSSLTRHVRVGEKYKKQIWAYAYNPTHMAGLQVFFQAFFNHNSIVNVFKYSRNDIYRLIRSLQITHISATPTFYRMLLPCVESFNSVVRVTLGGEKSDKNLYDFIKKLFPNAIINNVYASTEAGTLFAAKGDCFQIPESIIDRIKIVDSELMIHHSLLGESSSFHFIDGFYPTGDLIEWVDQANGLFRFVGRKNELINIGGYKVNPNEVEKEILSIEGVKQVIVYGKSNSILGNILCADIVSTEQNSINEYKIRKHLENRIQDFKIPRRIRFVESITLTRTGKTKRK